MSKNWDGKAMQFLQVDWQQAGDSVVRASWWKITSYITTKLARHVAIESPHLISQIIS